MHRKRRAR
jgi:hypothetical protein